MMTLNNYVEKKKMLEKYPALRYGALALIVLMVAVAAVQLIPGGSEDSAAAVTGYSIDLTDPANTPLGVTWNGTDTLTFVGEANGNVYSIEQNSNTRVPINLVVEGTVSTTLIISNITITGNIQLKDSASVNLLLSASNDIRGSVFVPTGTSITIDSASTPKSNNGSLTVTGGNLNVGIGGNNGTGGNITINGGTVNATGSSGAAGIGGGFEGDGGKIAINGGRVTATGGLGGGAGIGGGIGGSGGTITISGGTVTATGGESAAGIGGGDTGSGGDIIISGGTVTATCGISGGAGIGGGLQGDGGKISISGGEVTATGGSSGAGGIGGGYAAAGAELTIGSGANIKAYSNGNLPAIYARSITPSSTGYYVNCSFPSLPSGASNMNVYANGNTGTVLTSLNVPSGYKNFAFMIPGSSATKEYNINLLVEGGSRPLLRNFDNSPVIYSIKALNGYNAHNGSNGVLPLVLGNFVPNNIIVVSNITHLPSSATAGIDLTLTGIVFPANATNKTITWSVKNAGLTGAKISGDVLSTTGEGIVTVTATVNDGKGAGTAYTKDFDITVAASTVAFVPVTGITGVPSSATAGTDLTLVGTVAPSDATNKTITWKVENAGATGAVISGNTLSATGAGEVTVTAEIADGTATGTAYTKDFTIVVAAGSVAFVPVTDITGVPTWTTVGTDLTLTGTAAPSGATNKAIIWTVENEGDTGAVIIGNTLSATAAGNVTVTATVNDGKAAGTAFTKNFTITVGAAGEEQPESGGSGSNTMLLVAVVVVVVVLAAAALFFVHRKGMI